MSVAGDIRIALDGLRGEESIAALCRREGMVESLYYNWSKEFLEAGKKRLSGGTARAAITDEVRQLRLLKKARPWMGATTNEMYLKVIDWDGSTCRRSSTTSPDILSQKP